MRQPVLGVFGGCAAHAHDEELAFRVGGLAAGAGWVVLTGGGPGVMAAASRGAVEAGGWTVGVLPQAADAEEYPNPWVRLPIFTGIGMARNAVNVYSVDLAVAIGGGPGTLSEIALALKAGVEIWCVNSWRLAPPPNTTCSLPRSFDDIEEFLTALGERLTAGRGAPRR